MAVTRMDVQAGVDRLMFVPGQGHMIGLPSRPGESSAATTGVPTASIAGFAHGALFINYKGSSGLGTALYVNTGDSTTAVWTNVT